jgi:hypothetical protein
MVFLTLFLLINADLWQASESLTAGRLSFALLFFAAAAFLASIAKLRDERGALIAHLSTPPAGAETEAGTPGRVEPAAHAPSPAPKLPPLMATQQVNVTLALGARQIAQSLWVGVGVFLFLTALGVTVVLAGAATRWLGSGNMQLSFAPVPVALVHATVLLAGFAAMYFTVTSMNDPAYRERFFAPIAQNLQQILGTHAGYSAIVGPPSLNRFARTMRLTLDDGHAQLLHLRDIVRDLGKTAWDAVTRRRPRNR